MKYTLFFAVASAAVASAQVTYNSTTGVFTCPKDHENAAYCAGNSLESNIIIRCRDGVGQPGNCNDNLSGSFPFGVNFAPCFQTSPESGDAACSKNCVIQGGSGNFPGTSTISGCTPTSASSTSKETESSSSADSSNLVSTTTTADSGNSGSATTTTTSTAPTLTTTPLISTTLLGSSNATTNTPAGPPATTTAIPSQFTGAAVAKSAYAGLAGIGLIIAYLL